MKKNSFESSLKRLEQIVNEMENAELDIDKAMKLFEE
jgi:exodeoxyribonuclease VII small subunit